MKWLKFALPTHVEKLIQLSFDSHISDVRVTHKNCRMSSGIELIVTYSEVCFICSSYYQEKGKKRKGITFLSAGHWTQCFSSVISCIPQTTLSGGIINSVYTAKEIEAQRG